MSMSELALRGAEVAITGRLASMTRPEAVTRLSGVGAKYVSMPRASTDFLVVGRDGWPLASDGRLTNSLRVAEGLQGSGSKIEVVAEESFLELLEPEHDESRGPRLYTIGELSRILNVEPREIRSWMRRGLITPARIEKRLAYFEFREVANARSLQRLLADGATPSQIRHSLDRLEQWLPGAAGPIGQLVESQGELLVRLASGKLAEPSGQLRLAFEEAENESADVRLPSIAQRSQQDWFVEGVRREECGDLDRAADAYHEALLAGAARPEICFNLGNVLHSLRRKGEAAQRFMQAVELDPEYVEAWNNLGNTLAELGRSEKALSAYHRALELEPGYADAHFNLAATLEGLDRFDEARTHWVAYLRQDPNSADAEFVRSRLVQPVSDRS